MTVPQVAQILVGAGATWAWPNMRWRNFRTFFALTCAVFTHNQVLQPLGHAYSARSNGQILSNRTFNAQLLI
jgi:hypothetical protein